MLRAILKYLSYDIQSKKTFTFEDDLYAIGVSLKKLFQLSKEEKSYLKDCDLGWLCRLWAIPTCIRNLMIESMTDFNPNRSTSQEMTDIFSGMYIYKS
ncbi:hypothetical protein CleRT_07620 [Candidatus Coxiella mudrowiae]|uniref:Uncharacterized protein n=1 Tax=Candidatus Coxiella mudrowiae TaxID=2054173 RepID=A0ABN4HPF6_9COXI|nr:hypothetical protein CleRT_07620 [Candidatus Coxiella mudrowiae]